MQLVRNLRWFSFLLCLFACLFASEAHAQVAFATQTATSSTNTGTPGTSLQSNPITINSGSNRALLAGFVMDSGATTPAGLGCVFDAAGANQTMTAVTGTNTGTSGAISAAAVWFGLVAPAVSASKTITCSWTGSNTVGLMAVAFTGVDQTSAAVAFPHGNFASPGFAASPARVTITSATGNMTVGLQAQNCVAFTGGGSSGTLLTPELDMTNVGFVTNYANGAATVNMDATFSGTCTWMANGTDILAAGGGGGATSSSNLSLMGIGP